MRTQKKTKSKSASSQTTLEAMDSAIKLLEKKRDSNGKITITGDLIVGTGNTMDSSLFSDGKFEMYGEFNTYIVKGHKIKTLAGKEISIVSMMDKDGLEYYECSVGKDGGAFELCGNKIVMSSDAKMSPTLIYGSFIYRNGELCLVLGEMEFRFKQNGMPILSIRKVVLNGNSILFDLSKKNK